MALPLLGCAAFFVWHDSPLLTAVNLLGLAGAVTLGALRRRGPRLHLRGLVDFVGGATAAGVAALAGLIPILQRDIDWSELGSAARSTRGGAVARGIAIGAPLVILFGALFVAADAVFKSLVTSAVPHLGNPAAHAAVVGVAGWVTGGLLRDLAAPRDAERQYSAAVVVRRLRKPLTFGMGETTIVLGALDLLFFAFVLVQFRYLFGGKAVVLAQTNLTYAEYARHGFFELLAVTALAIPLLLLADWVVPRSGRRQELIFRSLSGALLGLLFVVIVSALQRMRLYVHEYGLTELRLYATGVIVWLAVVAVWFAATVLRGRRHVFAIGALVAGFAATAVFNALNPDALIVRTNLARPKVDPAYLASLSDDAVPTLLRRLESLPRKLRRPLATDLLRRKPSRADWRSWNVSRERARSALSAHRQELERFASGR
jgi:hypothetical protein